MTTNKTLEKYTNYQEYFKSFLGGWSFENGDETLTIKDVEELEMYDSQTQGKKKGLCLRFEEKELPMVLNTTNSETIAKVTGTDKLADWIGKKIIVGQQKIRAFGKEQLVIRVRDEQPKAKAKKKATKDQVQEIENLIQSGAITNKDAMLQYYKVETIEDLSQEEAQKLIDKKKKEEEF